MTGHPVARSVKTVSDGKREEVAVERERRVDVFVRPRKGQAALKRMKDESLSIQQEETTRVKNEKWERVFDFFTLPSRVVLQSASTNYS